MQSNTQLLDLAHVILSLVCITLFAVFIQEFTKNRVGRFVPFLSLSPSPHHNECSHNNNSLRPDFIARCIPDYSRLHVNVTENTYIEDASVCTGDPHTIIEGRKSFPSGHSCLSACSMVFLIVCSLLPLVSCRVIYLCCVVCCGGRTQMYLEYALPKAIESLSSFLKPVLQLCCLTFAIFICASRSMDNRSRSSSSLFLLSFWRTQFCLDDVVCCDVM